MEKDNVKESKLVPLVSIWCITYNQVDYIRDAIEGFLAQKTTFPYQIVIHDDASTDGTIDVLKEYERRYPELITVIYEKENIYKKPDRLDRINSIKKQYLIGKYVACCEGDDYWIDSLKLQKQVDYLETHKECVMVAHNYIREYCETGERVASNENIQTGTVTPEQVIVNLEPSLPTASLVLRREIFILEDSFPKGGMGDVSLKFYALTKGDIYYFDDVMCVYRYKANNSWTSKYHNTERYLHENMIRLIVFLQGYNKYTENKYKEFVRRRIRFFTVILFGMLYNERYRQAEVLEELKENLDVRYHSCIDRISTMYNKNSNYEEQEKLVHTYCAKNHNIYLWGTGIISDRWSKLLVEKGIEIQGYIVTENTGDDSFHGKPVWEIKDFPYDKNDVSILLAVGTWAAYEILQMIDKYEIKNYYCIWEMELE